MVAFYAVSMDVQPVVIAGLGIRLSGEGLHDWVRRHYRSWDSETIPTHPQDLSKATPSNVVSSDRPGPRIPVGVMHKTGVFGYPDVNGGLNPLP